jgi:hypothetical protein
MVAASTQAFLDTYIRPRINIGDERLKISGAGEVDLEGALEQLKTWPQVDKRFVGREHPLHTIANVMLSYRFSPDAYRALGEAFRGEGLHPNPTLARVIVGCEHFARDGWTEPFKANSDHLFRPYANRTAVVNAAIQRSWGL